MADRVSPSKIRRQVKSSSNLTKEAAMIPVLVDLLKGLLLEVLKAAIAPVLRRLRWRSEKGREGSQNTRTRKRDREKLVRETDCAGIYNS